MYPMHEANDSALASFCATGPAFYDDPNHPAAPSEEKTRALLSRTTPALAACNVALSCVEGRGRVAAIVNPHLRGDSGDPIGLLGFFECEDDAALARAILDAGCAWLRNQGCRVARGPMNFTTWHACRFVVEGQEAGWIPGDPHHPSYYPKLWESVGFSPLATYSSHWLLQPESELLRLRSRSEACLDGGYTLRRPAPEDRPVFHALTMRAFADAFMFSPIDPEEHAALYPESLLGGAAARHSALALAPDGEPVGYLWTFPARVAGRDALVAKTLAVVPEHRNRNVYSLLVADLFRNGLDHGFCDFVAAVMHVEGSPSRMGWIRDETRIKRYALHERALV
jgi:GNAT superfamily N-acetyltransferase